MTDSANVDEETPHPQRASQRGTAPSDSPPERWRGTGTVLIADDEPRVRQVLALMLGDLGFDVLQAETTESCLAMYRERAGDIRAVMVDLMMPGGGGAEVVRVLRAEGHKVPVVVSSGFSDRISDPSLRNDPNLTFLEKPFEYSTFIETLRKLLARS